MGQKAKTKVAEVKVDFSINFNKHETQKVINALSDADVDEYNISCENDTLKLKTKATPTQIYNFGLSNR